MVAAVLIGHGQFAPGLYHALAQIVGEVPEIEVIATDRLGRPGLEQLVAATRKRLAGRPLLVFADLQGGSCATTCGSCLRNAAEVAIICGVNLPLLIKYVQYRDRLSLKELYELLLQAGREGIVGLKPPG